MGWNLDRTRKERARFKARWKAEADARGLSRLIEYGRFFCQHMPYTAAHTIWPLAVASPFIWLLIYGITYAIAHDAGYAQGVLDAP